MFAELYEAMQTLIDPKDLGYVAWSHFESDEIGGLNNWLRIAPQAQPVCTFVGKVVSVDDFSLRPALGMTPNEHVSTGRFRFRFYATPHLPHGWDAGMMFEETQKTLFCSDLFHQFGDVAPLSSDDLTEATVAAMHQMQNSPLANSMTYNLNTKAILSELAKLQPKTLATMHGASYSGDGERMIENLSAAMKDIF